MSMERGYIGGGSPLNGKSSVMPKKGEETRDRIVEAANDLFYKQGFNKTSFAHIAESSGVPKGNFYFYFKTKDNLLDAVIEDRLTRLRDLLTSWETAEADPHARLDRLAGMLPSEMGFISRYGCPVGSLIAELGKSQPEKMAHARETFELLLAWSERQFAELVGSDEASMLARRLLARMQGMAMLSHAFADEAWVEEETADIRAWLATL